MKLSLDWSAYKDAGMGDAYADIPKQGGDYAKAIAACINSGQCETDSKLLMCPSFKFSGDTDLSTGGRVRLLKEALSADDWEQALENPKLSRALELCVSCKGCKRECDNNVDMALIKAEYMAWRAERQGLSLRSRIFAYIPHLLYRRPWLGKLILLRNRNGLLRGLSEKLLGVSAVMPLPEPAPQPFVTSNAAVVDQVEDDVAGRPELVLLVDTFSRYFEPEIPDAAAQVLRHAGYRIQFATAGLNEEQRPLCCGRTFLAQGLAQQARAEVQRLVDALTPHVQAGRVIIGFEASCVIGLRDDALALGLGESMRAIANNVQLFEEFLAKEIMAGRLQLPLDKFKADETLVHGHCHQKAVGAMKAVRRLMKFLPGAEFSLIESGCCGMAGTFSLEAEHQAMGSEMANRDLMPALKAKPDAAVIANGFSCRQQMRAHGDARARHLAVWLRDALSL